MQENKLVSAIITTHNRLDLLKQAIKSVKQQTYIDIEVIVVDDASTDGTKEYCTALTGIHYIYISPAESKGGNHARNVGIENSHGEYIAFLDDDDLWLSTKIEKQVEAMQMHLECDLCIGGFKEERIDNNKTLIYVPPYYTHQTELLDISKSCLYTGYAFTSTMLIRKNVFSKTELFDENLQAYQEGELIIRLAQLSKICRIYEPLIVYRVFCSDSQRITNRIFRWRLSMRYIYEKHKELYKSLTFREKLEVKHNYIAQAVARSTASARKYLIFRYIIELRLCRLMIKITEALGYQLK